MVQARPLCYRTACRLIEIARQPKLFAVRRRHLVHSTTVAADDGWSVNYNKRGVTACALEGIDHPKLAACGNDSAPGPEDCSPHGPSRHGITVRTTT
ncbi:MAG TPA: hypothetical protein VJ875_10590 [Pyrinomonadaceae bacterium]|nr:hypothetical protein [Pyrinomonadaceae bacterium]